MKQLPQLSLPFIFVIRKSMKLELASSSSFHWPIETYQISINLISGFLKIKAVFIIQDLGLYQLKIRVQHIFQISLPILSLVLNFLRQDVRFRSRILQFDYLQIRPIGRLLVQRVAFPYFVVEFGRLVSLIQIAYHLLFETFQRSIDLISDFLWIKVILIFQVLELN